MQAVAEKDTGDVGMIVKRVSVPIGLEELMEGLAKEVLLKKPKDLYIFASEYFSRLVILRERSSNHKAYPIRTVQSVTHLKAPDISKGKKIPPPRPTKHLLRQLSMRSKSPATSKINQLESRRNVVQKNRDRRSATDKKENTANDPSKTPSKRERSISTNRKDSTPRSTSTAQTTPREKRQRSNTRQVNPASNDPKNSSEPSKTVKAKKKSTLKSPNTDNTSIVKDKELSITDSENVNNNKQSAADSKSLNIPLKDAIKASPVIVNELLDSDIWAASTNIQNVSKSIVEDGDKEVSIVKEKETRNGTVTDEKHIDIMKEEIKPEIKKIELIAKEEINNTKSVNIDSELPTSVVDISASVDDASKDETRIIEQQLSLDTIHNAEIKNEEIKDTVAEQMLLDPILNQIESEIQSTIESNSDLKDETSRNLENIDNSDLVNEAIINKIVDTEKSKATVEFNVSDGNNENCDLLTPITLEEKTEHLTNNKNIDESADTGKIADNVTDQNVEEKNVTDIIKLADNILDKEPIDNHNETLNTANTNENITIKEGIDNKENVDNVESMIIAEKQVNERNIDSANPENVLKDINVLEDVKSDQISTTLIDRIEIENDSVVNSENNEITEKIIVKIDPGIVKENKTTESTEDNIPILKTEEELEKSDINEQENASEIVNNDNVEVIVTNRMTEPEQLIPQLKSEEMVESSQQLKQADNLNEEATNGSNKMDEAKTEPLEDPTDKRRDIHDRDERSIKDVEELSKLEENLDVKVEPQSVGNIVNIKMEQMGDSDDVLIVSISEKTGPSEEKSDIHNQNAESSTKLSENLDTKIEPQSVEVVPKTQFFREIKELDSKEGKIIADKEFKEDVTSSSTEKENEEIQIKITETPVLHAISTALSHGNTGNNNEAQISETDRIIGQNISQKESGRIDAPIKDFLSLFLTNEQQHVFKHDDSNTGLSQSPTIITDIVKQKGDTSSQSTEENSIPTDKLINNLPELEQDNHQSKLDTFSSSEGTFKNGKTLEYENKTENDNNLKEDEKILKDGNLVFNSVKDLLDFNSSKTLLEKNDTVISSEKGDSSSESNSLKLIIIENNSSDGNTNNLSEDVEKVEIFSSNAEVRNKRNITIDEVEEIVSYAENKDMGANRVEQSSLEGVDGVELDTALPSRESDDNSAKTNNNLGSIELQFSEDKTGNNITSQSESNIDERNTVNKENLSEVEINESLSNSAKNINSKEEKENGADFMQSQAEIESLTSNSNYENDAGSKSYEQNKIQILEPSNTTTLINSDNDNNDILKVPKEQGDVSVSVKPHTKDNVSMLTKVDLEPEDTQMEQTDTPSLESMEGVGISKENTFIKNDDKDKSKVKQRPKIGDIEQVATVIEVVKNIYDAKSSTDNSGVTSIREYLNTFVQNEQGYVFQDKKGAGDNEIDVNKKSHDDDVLNSNKLTSKTEASENNETNINKKKKGKITFRSKQERSLSQTNLLNNERKDSASNTTDKKVRRARSVDVIKMGEKENKSKIPTSARRSAGRRPLVRQLEANSKELEEKLNFKKSSAKNSKEDNKKDSSENQISIQLENDESQDENIREDNSAKKEFSISNDSRIAKDDVLIAKTILKGIEGAEKHIELIDAHMNKSGENTTKVNDDSVLLNREGDKADKSSVQDFDEKQLRQENEGIANDTEIGVIQPVEQVVNVKEKQTEVESKSDVINKSDASKIDNDDPNKFILAGSQNNTSEQLNNAATTIQKTWKGFHVRHDLKENKTGLGTNKPNQITQNSDTEKHIESKELEKHIEGTQNKDFENFVETNQSNLSEKNAVSKEPIEAIQSKEPQTLVFLNPSGEVIESSQSEDTEAKQSTSPEAHIVNKESREEKAAVKIQSAWKGFIARKMMNKSITQGQKSKNNQEEAIIKIQAVVRGFLGRLKYGNLKSKHIKTESKDIENISKKDDTINTSKNINGVDFQKIGTESTNNPNMQPSKREDDNHTDGISRSKNQNDDKINESSIETLGIDTSDDHILNINKQQIEDSKGEEKRNLYEFDNDGKLKIDSNESSIGNVAVESDIPKIHDEILTKGDQLKTSDKPKKDNVNNEILADIDDRTNITKQRGEGPGNENKQSQPEENKEIESKMIKTMTPDNKSNELAFHKSDDECIEVETNITKIHGVNLTEDNQSETCDKRKKDHINHEITSHTVDMTNINKRDEDSEDQDKQSQQVKNNKIDSKLINKLIPDNKPNDNSSHESNNENVEVETNITKVHDVKLTDGNRSETFDKSGKNNLSDVTDIDKQHREGSKEGNKQNQQEIDSKLTNEILTDNTSDEIVDNGSHGSDIRSMEVDDNQSKVIDKTGYNGILLEKEDDVRQPLEVNSNIDLAEINNDKNISVNDNENLLEPNSTDTIKSNEAGSEITVSGAINGNDEKVERITGSLKINDETNMSLQENKDTSTDENKKQGDSSLEHSEIGNIGSVPNEDLRQEKLSTKNEDRILETSQEKKNISEVRNDNILDNNKSNQNEPNSLNKNILSNRQKAHKLSDPGNNTKENFQNTDIPKQESLSQSDNNVIKSTNDETITETQSLKINDETNMALQEDKDTATDDNKKQGDSSLEHNEIGNIGSVPNDDLRQEKLSTKSDDRILETSQEKKNISEVRNGNILDNNKSNQHEHNSLNKNILSNGQKAHDLSDTGNNSKENVQNTDIPKQESLSQSDNNVIKSTSDETITGTQSLKINDETNMALQEDKDTATDDNKKQGDSSLDHSEIGNIGSVPNEDLRQEKLSTKNEDRILETPQEKKNINEVRNDNILDNNKSNQNEHNSLNKNRLSNGQKAHELSDTGNNTKENLQNSDIPKQESLSQSDNNVIKSTSDKPDFYRSNTVIEPLLVKKTIPHLGDDTDKSQSLAQDQSVSQNQKDDNNNTSKEETELERDVRSAVHEILGSSNKKDENVTPLEVEISQAVKHIMENNVDTDSKTADTSTSKTESSIPDEKDSKLDKTMSVLNNLPQIPTHEIPKIITESSVTSSLPEGENIEDSKDSVDLSDKIQKVESSVKHSEVTRKNDTSIEHESGANHAPKAGEEVYSSSKLNNTTNIADHKNQSGNSENDESTASLEIPADDVSSVGSVDSVVTVILKPKHEISKAPENDENKIMSQDIKSDKNDVKVPSKRPPSKALSTSALEDHVELIDQVQNSLLDQLSGKATDAGNKFNIDQLRQELDDSLYKSEDDNNSSGITGHDPEVMEYLYDFDPDDDTSYDSRAVRTPLRELPDIAEESESKEDDADFSRRAKSSDKAAECGPTTFCGTPNLNIHKDIDGKPLQDHVEIINSPFKSNESCNEIIINNDNIEINKAGNPADKEHPKLLHSSELHDTLIIPASSIPLQSPHSDSIRGPSPASLTSGPSSLKHTSEFHDTVVVPLPSGADMKIKNASKKILPEDTMATSQTNSMDRGNQTSTQQAPAGVEVVTSRRRSQDGVDDAEAQASLKDTSPAKPESGGSFTHQSPPQSPRSAKQAMESGNNNNNNKRNNAISNKVPAAGKNMESEAATKIQAGFRGYQVRKQLKAKNAAIDQKRQLRKRSSRENMKDPELEEKSAVKIQAGVRGFLVRRRQKKQVNSSASA